MTSASAASLVRLGGVTHSDKATVDDFTLTYFESDTQRIVEHRPDYNETVLVLLSGACEIEVPGNGAFPAHLKRHDVFSAPPSAVYVPAGRGWQAEMSPASEVVVIQAGGNTDLEPYVICPDDVRTDQRGRGSWQREVRTVLGEDRPANRLLVGETVSVEGGWSSYPPHKHDEDLGPTETAMREIYYVRFSRPEGFGLARLYRPNAKADGAHVLLDGDMFTIEGGYHTVVAAGGYRMYYLWALSGRKRQLRWREDPEHAGLQA